MTATTGGEVRWFEPGEVVVGAHGNVIEAFVVVAGTADVALDDRWLGILCVGDVVGARGDHPHKPGLQITARSRLEVRTTSSP